VTPTKKLFFGKYRGIVSDNRDPDSLGKIRARVPDVLGDLESGWAQPCTPYAGRGVGLFMIPPRDAMVWIEFEQGDTEKPIWSGCFWERGDLPQEASSVDRKVLKTSTTTVVIDDASGSGEVTIETAAGMKVVLSSSGIEITNGQAKIVVSGPRVNINDDALEVM
jgi:uncharacterized protein involved in type VI secretion and phage assembly